VSQAYEVRLASPARRDLRRVPPRIVPAIVEFLFGELAGNPKRVGKALERELEGYWSARRGPYRIIYRIDDDQLIVLVVNVDHRADVYRPR
jgi:mRNA interferase RelE/StbE